MDLVSAALEIELLALGQPLDAAPVEMEVQQRRVGRAMDAVDVVGHQRHPGPGGDHRLVDLLEPSLARRGAVVDAPPQPVRLLALDADDHGPGGVVVRRRRALALGGDRIEREAVGGVLRQDMHGAALVQERELLGREQVVPGRERKQPSVSPAPGPRGSRPARRGSCAPRPDRQRQRAALAGEIDLGRRHGD